MKTEEWLTVVGFFMFILVVISALIPETFWEDNALAVNPSQVTATTAWSGSTSVMRNQQQAMAVPVAVVRPNKMPPKRTIKAQPGLMPFEQAPRVRFEGSIQQISEMPGKDGQIHVWLHNPMGVEQHLSVSPGWFLEYMGCPLLHDATLSGVGFKFDKTKDGATIYVKKLVIGKTVCHLRNDEGFALWSNRLR